MNKLKTQTDLLKRLYEIKTGKKYHRVPFYHETESEIITYTEYYAICYKKENFFVDKAEMRKWEKPIYDLTSKTLDYDNLEKLSRNRFEVTGKDTCEIFTTANGETAMMDNKISKLFKDCLPARSKDHPEAIFFFNEFKQFDGFALLIRQKEDVIWAKGERNE